ncbi:MAG: hypothetical protein WBL82_00110, partial [Terriglobales bacterium]
MRRLAGGVCLLLAVVCAAGICLADDTPGAAQTPAAASVPAAGATPASVSSSLPGGDSTATPAAGSSSASSPSSDAVVPAAVFSPASRKDRKAAHHAFTHGLKLQQSNQLDQAFYEFEEAARLDPEKTEYVVAREMTREHLASTHLDLGNTELLQGRQTDALAEFRAALNLDPQNEFAQQRVRDALGPPPASGPGPAQVVARQDDLAVKPLEARHDFHYRGDARGLLTAVATSYGLSVNFDDSFPTRQVRFDIDQADFHTALQAASEVTKTFSVAVEDT